MKKEEGEGAEKAYYGCETIRERLLKTKGTGGWKRTVKGYLSFC